MSGVQSVSTERLNSLLSHITHQGYDDLVDPKNQGIAYPTGNPDLLITGDPLFYTNLLATLDMFRLNSASLTFGTTDEGNQFRRRQKLARTKFSFKCTRENPMPSHRWESYLRQVKAMVVDHFVRSIRHQSKNLPKHYEVLFTGSEVPTGPTELSQVQRNKRKLGTMGHALIAEHTFTPNLDTYTGDDAIIDTFTREDSARATRSNSRGDRLLLDRKKAEWKRHLATVRSTLSEIFLWFIREVSTTEIQQDFEQVIRSHILQNQEAGGGLVNPFNGDILIAHIESNYVTDNSDSITAIERKFEAIDPLNDRFGSPTDHLESDYGSPLLSASETDQKRKSSPTTTKDRSDKKRIKSKKTSPASKSRKTIPNHSQCNRPGCVSRGTSVTHTHAQCFYKYKGNGASPTTSLLVQKTNPPPRTKFAGSTSVKLASTSRRTSKFIKFSQGSSSATPKKDPSEIDCWTCGQKGHYSSDCPSNTKSKWELRWPQM